METETKPAPVADAPGTEKKKGTLTFRPLKHQENFLNNLIKEKGTVTLACQETVELAMNSTMNRTVSDQDHEQVKKLQQQLKAAEFLHDNLKKEKENLQNRVNQLLANSPYDESTIKAMKVLIEKKSLKDETAAIKYALAYTLKNDWL